MQGSIREWIGPGCQPPPPQHPHPSPPPLHPSEIPNLLNLYGKLDLAKLSFTPRQHPRQT